MNGDMRWVDPDRWDMFKTMTDAMTEMETRIHVKSRYLPIRGVTSEVPGTSSIRSI
jgi:hypothetical protein